MLTEERKEELRKLYGRTLFFKLKEELQTKKITLEQYLETYEWWLTEKGYIKTGMGWMKPQEIAAMGLVKRGDHWAVGSKEQVTRRIIGVGRNQREEIVHNSIPNEMPKQSAPNLPLEERRQNVQALSSMVEEVFDVE